MNISIYNIRLIVYYHTDYNTSHINLEYNRVTLQQLLNLCNAYGGIDHVTVILWSGRRVNLGIRNAETLFTDGQVDI